jgi:hypothetical protein
MHEDLRDEQKIAYWKNTVNDFRGHHENCPKGHSQLEGYPEMNNPLAEQ